MNFILPHYSHINFYLALQQRSCCSCTAHQDWSILVRV